jgi:hypothetical protein
MSRRQQVDLNDPILAEVMRNQLDAFVSRFGRKPTPHDPVFFCWHSNTPQPMCALYY